ncbi:hypothetical protein J7643_04570 [bacterium]|nr:hypothetical protein [bacterium]
MVFQSPRHVLAALAAATLTLVGCIAPASVPEQRDAATSVPKVKLFTNSTGLGSLTMRVVDQRRAYGTQAVADADPWDQLFLRVNSARLKGARMDTVLRNVIPANNVFTSPVLTGLPPAADYQLLVSLATGSSIVGQGASSSIRLDAGKDATVSIYINTVGQIWFDSPTYVATASTATESIGFPMLMAEQPIDVLTSILPASPFKAFYTEFRDQAGTLLNATTSVTVTGAGSPSQTVTVPALSAGDPDAIRDVTIVGLDDANKVVSRRTRKVLVQRGAGISVNLQ